MLTITTAGQSVNDALSLVKNALNGKNDDSLKILIDGPVQAEAIKKFLESQGFNDVLLEDDEGTLYLTVPLSKNEPQPAPSNLLNPVKVQPQPILHETQTQTQKPGTLGIIISCRNKDYQSSFIRKFLLSILKTEIKPDVIALLDSAVKISAYNSPLCVILKKLETSGIQILISESCADRLGITDAAGAGVIADMSEILDEIFSCSKIISI